MTTPGTTELALEAEETAAAAALTAGLAAVAELYDEALSRIAALAEHGDQADATDVDEAGTPADEVRVLRMAERPVVGQRVESAAA
ncbi:hypothetical protein [Modestobacter versicolor]|uniref:hypothetical protein n=1 Tax=Modestobacter versicolor TaxID=429133 RepID=UPI0034DE642D